MRAHLNIKVFEVSAVACRIYLQFFIISRITSQHNYNRGYNLNLKSWNVCIITLIHSCAFFKLFKFLHIF